MSFNPETAAVVFAVLYLVLAIRQHIGCWLAAIVSTSLYTYVFYTAQLYMETALQLFYIAMALFGWWQWRGGVSGVERSVSTWTLRQHFFAIALIITLATTSGFLLNHYTNAALPYIDSLTTWGGVVATYMVARKIFENWHYWFVIDSVSIYLYINRDLTQTAWLFGLYLILIVVGIRQWRKDLPAPVILTHE